LGGRKGIWPVKNSVVGAWLSVWREVQTCIWPSPADATATYYLLLQKIQIGFTFLVLPFWYWLTQVVQDSVQGAVKWL